MVHVVPSSISDVIRPERGITNNVNEFLKTRLGFLCSPVPVPISKTKGISIGVWVVILSRHVELDFPINQRFTEIVQCHVLFRIMRWGLFCAVLAKQTESITLGREEISDASGQA